MRKVALGLVVAVVGLIVVGVVVLRDEETASAVDFEVLHVGEVAEPIGTLRVATTDDGYGALWESAGGNGEPPGVDLAEQVVVSITIPDDACAPDLRGFGQDGDTFTPVFVETETDCPEPLIPKTYVVALDRAPLEPGFRLALPGRGAYGAGDSVAVADLHQPAPEPDCAAIEVLDEDLDTIGVPADVSPSASPSELVGESSVAFRGRLTGGYALAGTYDEPAIDTAFLEVEVTEHLSSGPAAPVLHERELVGMAIGLEDVDRFPELAAAAAGVPVVVVADLHPPEVPRLIVAPEGFAIACEGGPLLGRTGFQGEWAELETLDELADALSGER